MNTKYILGLLLVFSIHLMNGQNEISIDFKCDCPHTDESYNNNIELNHVTFHGDDTNNDHLIPIERHEYGLYPEIQYFSRANFFPVAYVSGSHALVSASFNSSCSHPLWIRGTFDNGVNKFCFDSKFVHPQVYGDYHYPITAADVPFEGDHVDAFQEFEIYWEVSPDKVNWAHVGTSVNPLYVTFHEPLDVSVHHSTISNSSTWAAGGRSAREIIDGIYDLYQTRCIPTVSDKGRFSSNCLKYWGDEDLSIACENSSDLFVRGNGRSENFAELFVDMIKVQGIYHSKVINVTYENEDTEAIKDELRDDVKSVFTNTAVTPMNVAMNAAGIITVAPAGLSSPQLYVTYDTEFKAAPLAKLSLENTTMMYVKGYSSPLNNSFFLADEDNLSSFTSRPNGVSLSKLVDDSGIIAQGNNNPPSRFSKLFLVDYFGTIYDPSYGVTSSENVGDWESKVLDAYGMRLFEVPLRNNNSVPPGVEDHTLEYIHQVESGDQQTTVNQ